jgi:hypothetical protein
MMDGLTKIKFWADESGRSGSLRPGALSGWRLGAALVLLLVLLAIGAVAAPWRLGGADGRRRALSAATAGPRRSRSTSPPACRDAWPRCWSMRATWVVLPSLSADSPAITPALLKAAAMLLPDGGNPGSK